MLAHTHCFRGSGCEYLVYGARHRLLIFTPKRGFLKNATILYSEPSTFFDKVSGTDQNKMRRANGIYTVAAPSEHKLKECALEGNALEMAFRRYKNRWQVN